MLDPVTAQERCAALIDLALRHGADAADSIAIGSASQSVDVRLGKLEGVDRSETADIGLRVFIGSQSASISASDLSDDALSELAERAVTMARAAPEDAYAGLAPEEKLAHGPFPDFDLVDSFETSPEWLRDRAMEVEDAARGVTGVTNSEGGSASVGQSCAALATSHGFSGFSAGTSHSISASVIAGEGSAMQRDYDYATRRHVADLPSCAAIGRSAGERAVARLDPGRLPSGPMPVVLDPRVGGSLIGHLLGAMSGPAIARRSSFLLGRENDVLFPENLRILDDPHRQRGLRSRAFDGEGLATAPRPLVEGGRITGWLANCAAARQLGIAPTGHAARGAGGSPGVSASNVHLEAGPCSREELIADIADGILVTELFGQGVNMVTGDYSRGASGFRIIGGEIAGPVAEFTIAGHLIDMFNALKPANDLEMIRGVNVPSLRIDGMTIAGT
ncbi:TldD/PmbA family protein [Altericroceibacterium spongiae]|uniref:TldD/PmbA family protein n=1 Tax=Altericroceibacterium spongiae TaxID=2320269 RepID=A0A420EPZ6_9SPHN|nr:TldD/PmbA family protein [Altericroceibacterium spongiae]RKF22738.1 TldD/PmbA family protein [Altericroceibacterium spongiae]